MSSGRSFSGGQVDRDRVESVEQVLAESAFPHLPLQLAVRRREEAHVHVQHSRRAHRLHFAELQRPEELGLQLAWQLGDLVEEHRPFVS
jgi:hypothetical protein